MADREVEHEICGNCKKEIPHFNYVMHSAHCQRNIRLCKTCDEPIPRQDFNNHKCRQKKPEKPSPPPTAIEKSEYYQERKAVADQKIATRRENYLKRHEHLAGNTLRSEPPNGAIPKDPKMLPCQYCDLELPKAELGEHENYCGSRTDRCVECGQIVMFRDRRAHEDGGHARPAYSARPPRRDPFVFDDFDVADYLPPSYGARADQPKKEKGESYKEISRRLDCPAPQPPRRRNPPTELTIPCEFCDVPIPHHDLIRHETGCRPDLVRYRRRSATPEDEPPQPGAYEEDLPCEFCEHMFPASQLLLHQATCQ